MLATLRRIWNLILKELTHLKRDRLLAPFVILGPLSELIAVAYVSSVGIESLPLVVVDGSRTDASRALVQAIEHTGVFAAPLFLDDVQAALPLMESGAVVAVVVIPPDFQEALLRPDRPATVQMLVDGSEPPAAQTALDAVQGVVAAYGARLLLESGARASPEAAPVWARLRVWFNEELKQSNYEIPSELGFMLSGVTIMVASLGIAREREMGTLEQLLVTPIRTMELIIGKTVTGIVMGYAVFLAMLAVSILGFALPMRGSWPLLLGLGFFYILVEVGWGVMISAVSPTQLQALLVAFVLMMVEVIFSGYAFPVESMSPAMRTLANIFPIKHWLLVFRDILLKGVGPWAFWQELVALAVLGSLILTATWRFVRWKRLE